MGKVKINIHVGQRFNCCPEDSHLLKNYWIIAYYKLNENYVNALSTKMFYDALFVKDTKFV